MGNRLSNGAWSPKRKEDKRRPTAKGGGAEADATAEATPPPPTQTQTRRGSVVGAASATKEDNSNATLDANASLSSAAATTSPWPRVAATVHAVDALETPVAEASERQRQRREQQARTRADPALFFRVHGSAGSADSDHNDEIALQYAHAVMLIAGAEEAENVEAIEAAATLLRPIAARPVAAPLAADARVHLARCLLLLDATLRGATSASHVETLLVESVSGELGDELARHATELLAYVQMARRETHSALELLEQGDSTTPTSSKLAFQRACCRHLIGANAVEDDLCCEQNATTAPIATSSRHAALLQAEAGALLVGPQ